jgi:hypothetical protein
VPDRRVPLRAFEPAGAFELTEGAFDLVDGDGLGEPFDQFERNLCDRYQNK